MPERKPPSKRQLAVALRYHEDREAAPRVLAKGRGRVAERIVEIARERGIPIRDDPDLVEALAKLDTGSLIPSELYPAVAEVLAFVYRQSQRRAGEGRGRSS
ncbi:MAG: EscU/YscU/HrcU family type III secretion system export apparatus switch protein [Planctomycetota bacterium]|jgi:flagellar biosynthesis protein|nr:EscU/YscU/HrcU family type III secretion system export apparatus switch protein [Planctomycetota bacterium]